MLKTWAERVRTLGPGLLLAAAGIGAGDVVVASVTGIRFGTTLLWAVVFTVALKYVLTEALARWQLATGETIVHAWITRLPAWVGIYFGAYLLLWTFLVGASLSSACGIAAASLWPKFSVIAWAALHALVAAVLVVMNRYARFQRVMKGLIALMAACVVVAAGLTRPAPGEVVRGLLVPVWPEAGGAAAVLALLGGIGGSVTVICYAYWMRAAGWRGAARLPQVRADLRLAYVFTGLFGVALIVIAAGVEANTVSGARIAVQVAAQLEVVAGPGGRWIFLVGFWCTVFTAMLGVWQAVPQVFVDLVAAWRARAPRNAPTPIAAPGDSIVEPARSPAGDGSEAGGERRTSRVYLAALVYLAGPPLGMLWFKQPVALVVTFSVAGAFFMPFLAGTLLYLNNRREWVGALANGRLGNAALVVCLLVFGAVCVREIVTTLTGS